MKPRVSFWILPEIHGTDGRRFSSLPPDARPSGGILVAEKLWGELGLRAFWMVPKISAPIP